MIGTTDNITDMMFLMNSIVLAQYSTDKRLKKKTGALIVKDGVIVGQGNRRTVILHRKPYLDITFHAEHIALMQCRSIAKGATVYTVMEPCACRSMSPINAWEPSAPCCQILFEAGIARVVFAIYDTNFGRGGADYLISKGVQVDICKLPDHILSTLNVIPEQITYKRAE